MAHIRLKRAYEAATPEDGLRVLVDRLWPRGLSRDRARIDLWLKDIAPSDGLRRWFNHDPKKWAEFQQRYRRELATRPEPFAELRRLVKENERVTLLFAAKDADRNNAVVVAGLLGDDGADARQR